MSARDELATVLLAHRYDKVRAVCACSDEVQVGLHCDPETHEQHTAGVLIAAGYVKAEPVWAETLLNDGDYEYTISSDCDGSSVRHWRRIPGMTFSSQPAPWETYEPEETK
jgi:hypothetical protein